MWLHCTTITRPVFDASVRQYFQQLAAATHGPIAQRQRSSTSAAHFDNSKDWPELPRTVHVHVLGEVSSCLEAELDRLFTVFAADAVILVRTAPCKLEQVRTAVPLA